MAGDERVTLKQNEGRTMEVRPVGASNCFGLI